MHFISFLLIKWISHPFLYFIFSFVIPTPKTTLDLKFQKYIHGVLINCAKPCSAGSSSQSSLRLMLLPSSSACFHSCNLMILYSNPATWTQNGELALTWSVSSSIIDARHPHEQDISIVSFIDIMLMRGWLSWMVTFSESTWGAVSNRDASTYFSQWNNRQGILQ